MFHKEQPHEHLVQMDRSLLTLSHVSFALLCLCVNRSHDVYRLMSWMIILMTFIVLMADMM